LHFGKCNDFQRNAALVAWPRKEGLLHMNKMQEESGRVLIFRAYIRMKDGKIIYPKNGRCFPLRVKA